MTTNIAKWSKDQIYMHDPAEDPFAIGRNSTARHRTYNYIPIPQEVSRRKQLSAAWKEFFREDEVTLSSFDLRPIENREDKFERVTRELKEDVRRLERIVRQSVVNSGYEPSDTAIRSLPPSIFQGQYQNSEPEHGSDDAISDNSSAEDIIKYVEELEDSGFNLEPSSKIANYLGKMLFEHQEAIVRAAIARALPSANPTAARDLLLKALTTEANAVVRSAIEGSLFEMGEK